MPVKVHIVDEQAVQKLPTREVEIPDTCPGCGADLTDAGDDSLIVEAGFVYYSAHQNIVKGAETSDFLDGNGSFEECFDAGTMHTGFMCNACEYDLTGPKPSDVMMPPEQAVRATYGKDVMPQLPAQPSEAAAAQAMLAELDGNIAAYYADEVDIEGFREKSAATWKKIGDAGLHSAVLGLVRARNAEDKSW
jgi:hypothetical protein